MVVLLDHKKEIMAYIFQGLCAMIMCIRFNFYTETMKVMNNVSIQWRLLKMILFEVILLPCINNESGCLLHFILTSKIVCP